MNVPWTTSIFAPGHVNVDSEMQAAPTAMPIKTRYTYFPFRFRTPNVEQSAVPE